MVLRLSKITVQLAGMTKPLFKIRDLEIEAGSRVLIQGPSGKGKTTLLHLMAGLLAPTEGEVQIADRKLQSLPESELAIFRREQVGLIFQKLNLISHLTALENVKLGSARDIGEAAETALRQVKMIELANVLAGNLSLGQQQRVAVARVLAKKPNLVLADEPTSSLDDENASAVMAALLGLPKSSTVIVVSHDHRIRDKFSRVLDFDELIGKAGR